MIALHVYFWIVNIRVSSKVLGVCTFSNSANNFSVLVLISWLPSKRLNSSVGFKFFYRKTLTISTRIFQKRYRQTDLLCPNIFFRPKKISKERNNCIFFSSPPFFFLALFFFSFSFPWLVTFWSLSGPGNLPFDPFSLQWRQRLVCKKSGR